MDAIWIALNDKLSSSGRYQTFINEYLLLRTDTDRVKYVMQLMLDYSIPITPISTPKSSSASRAFREEGNRLFTMPSSKPQLDESIEQYTKSIIFAPNNSEELSLAYANRSAVFFKAHHYQDCLLDITRALNLPYPDNLRSKLYARQVRCLLTSKISSKAQKIELEESLENARFWLEKMDPNNQAKSFIEETLKDAKKMTPSEEPFVKWNAAKNLPKLKGKENREIPGVSDSVELRYSDEFGRHMVATRDIYPGEVLGVMTPYASVLYPEKRFSHCWGCLEQTWSSVPCEHCVNVMYCNEYCRDRAWEEHHDIECDIIGPLDQLALAMRLAVRAVKEAGGVDRLRKKVEKLEGKVGRTSGFTGGILNDKDYASVYTLVRNTEKRPIMDLFVQSFFAAYITFMLATRSKMFGEKLEEDLKSIMENEEVMFIGGLVSRNSQIVKMNSLIITEVAPGPNPITERGVALMPFYSLINHSCCPQVHRDFYGQSMVLHADTIIRNGEQIFDTYGPHYTEMSKAERQAKLQHAFHFTCKCQSCIENWPTYDRILSYQQQCLGSSQRDAITNAVRNYDARFYKGSAYIPPETVPAMVAGINEVLKVLALNAVTPCKESHDILDARRLIQSFLGNRFESPNAPNFY